MPDQRPPHHPAIDALVTAVLSEEDVYLLGKAYLSVIGKSQVPHAVPPFGGGRIERWAGEEFRKSLQYFVTGVDPDES